MKVIMPISHIYCPEIPGADKNKSGFSYMARSIADELGKYCELSILIQSSLIQNNTQVNTFMMLKKTISDLIASFSITYFNQALNYSLANHFTLKKTLRVICYFFTGAYLERIIKKNAPDVIYIHDESDYTIPFLLAAARTNTKTVITSHGLGCLNRDVVAMTDFQAFCEESLFSVCDKNDVTMTVISSGMKFRMSRKLGNSLHNVRIISNFVGNDIVTYSNNNHKILETKNEKKILCVGSVYVLKNQRQLIDAVALCNENKKPMRLCIVGDGPDLYGLKEYVRKKEYTFVDFLGRLSHEEVCKQYYSCTAVALVSVNDGFGLPVLEGYCFGRPAVMFSDLDAFPDLYNPNTMIGVYDRSTKELADALMRAIDADWDEEYIKEFAESFSKERIGKAYFEALNDESNAFPLEYFHTIYSLVLNKKRKT